MTPPVGTRRNVNFQERKGSDTEYPVTREHLDFILDGVRHMPDPGKIVEPLGWLLVGIAGTAGFEAYNADHGSQHRHLYVTVAIATAVAGIVSLFCDRKLKREGQKHAKWLEKYVLELYTQFDITPPGRQPGWFRRCWNHLTPNKLQTHLTAALQAESAETPARRAAPVVPSAPDVLEIVSAIYGVGDLELDVTESLAARVSDGVLDFIVDNATMGGDPAPNRGKTLRLRWTIGGVDHASAFLEGTHVVIP